MSKGKHRQDQEQPLGMPAELVICGEVFHVDYIPRMLAEQGKYGELADGQHTIRVALDQNNQAMRRTLLHEALHACLELSSGHRVDPEDVESLIRCLELPLLSLIRDNQVCW